jgi:hypothetical protein
MVFIDAVTYCARWPHPRGQRTRRSPLRPLIAGADGGVTYVARASDAAR